ncbi:hypothetical protein OKA04_00535 [Luteolibacter flavescens]|uniref:Uncharacterized protein n=1 Tax=Luteolibacter flavescens TaxID=1859460 RepID=A0ABT3FHZ9_9BACT|nr:hypothetical protein [Luteolibacter flavescens]MCW1883194.1 hypothetical protein [Luteolibacter flavescens]
MSLFSAMAAAVLTAVGTLEAQTYKIGDIHPDGGIVFTVDESGTKGKVVEEKDSGTYDPAEVGAIAREKGWGVPYMKDLTLVYQNLHKQDKGNFQQALYQAVDASSAQYRKGIHFNNGKEETGIAQNNKTLVRFVRDFKPGLREKIVASGATWEGDWSWANDDSHGKNHSKLTIKSETDFVYVYMDQRHELKGKIGYAGGNPQAPLCVNLDLPNGDHLRFEWKSENELEGHFWQKGQKDGQQQNNTPETTAKMTRVASK